MSGQHKYRAFISYSHADEKWAAWLHKALETYKVPKHLVGKATDYGPVPERIAPIFRDREELASSTELGDVLTEALKQSACLIVICSPNAAKSRWTNEEILTYKRLGRQDRIFCLIIDGEPNASQFEETAEFECFPEGLMYQMGPDGNLTDTRSEPIAADAREGKDNKQNAKLKLIAGMIGVGFDDLKQRELHRRHQRMVAVTVAAAIGMAITTGLAATAWFARIEAVQQRVLAEEKAEEARQTTQFMVGLFSVSDPSEARGNTITAREILDKGADRINAELADQPRIQATLMDTMGTVYKSVGLYPQASDLLNEALTKRRAVLGDEHADVALTRAHLAEVLSLQAKYEDAEPMYREALAAQRRLFGDEAAEVAESLLGLAEVLTQKGEFEEAEPLLRQSLEIRLALFGEENLDVAESIERVGLNLFDQGDLDAAEPYLRQAIDVRRRLAGDEPHPGLANGLNDLGFLLYDKGELVETEQLWREALAMNRRLLEPNHPDIAFNLFNLAAVSHDKGNFDTAESLYREVLEIRRHVFGEQHPDIAFTLNNFAFLLYDKGDHRAAIDMETESIEMYRGFFPDGHPALARALATLGGWLSRENQFGQAEPLLNESLDMRKGFLGESHPEIAGGMTRLAYLYLKTGRTEEARGLANDARLLFAELLPPGHWRTAWSASVEGASLTAMKQFEAAEQLLLESYKILLDNPGGGSRAGYIEETRGFLADLYRIWGKPEQAARYVAHL